MSNKKISTLAALAVASLILAGCATSGENGPEPEESKALGCMVTNSGGLEDRSFNQSTWQGLEKAKTELSVTTRVLVSESASDLIPNVNTMVAEKCDLIVTVGWELWDATDAAAKANPGIAFAIVDEMLDAKNVRSIVFDTAQASFLAGYLAAAMTKTGIVATFGGDLQPPVMLFMDGFVDGVAHYNLTHSKGVQVIGWDKTKQDGLITGDYENIAAGRTMTEGLLAQNADVIMPVAGQVGEGAAAAVLDHGNAYVIWVDSDGYETAPKEFQPIMLTSVLKRMDTAVFKTVEDLLNGVFSNEPYIGTLENGGVAIADTHDVKVPASVLAEIEALKKQIISGELEITSPSSPKK
ncbi:MAG: BMP family ABC transporter substrate-binding protein [Microbacteriaceae bacterium]